jgi:hypothetical protein
MSLQVPNARFAVQAALKLARKLMPENTGIETTADGRAAIKELLRKVITPSGLLLCSMRCTNRQTIAAGSLLLGAWPASSRLSEFGAQKHCMIAAYAVQRTLGSHPPIKVVGSCKCSCCTSQQHSCCSCCCCLPSTLLQLSTLEHEFNVFDLSKVTDKPLKFAFLGALQDFGLIEKLEFPFSKVERLADSLQAVYNANSYHSATHAADTTQMMAHLLHQDNLAAAMSPLEMFAALLAAAGHDAAHCGKCCLLIMSLSQTAAVDFNTVANQQTNLLLSTWFSAFA